MKAFTRPAIVATCASVAALYITGGVTQSLVTKEHYIKVFDRTMVEAVERMQAQIEELRRAKEDRQQLELRLDDEQRAAAASAMLNWQRFSAPLDGQASSWPADFFKLCRKRLRSRCSVCRQD